MDGSPNSVVAQLRSGVCPQLHSAERRVADCILADIARASIATSAELSRISGASEATITRLCHKLGFENYRRFQLALARDVINLNENGTVENTEDLRQNTALIFMESRMEELKLLTQSLDVQKLIRAAERLNAADVIEAAAAGHAIPAALDLSLRLSAMGKRCVSSAVPEKTLDFARTLTERDVLLVLAEPSRSSLLEQTARLAKEGGATVLVISRERRAPVTKQADELFLLPHSTARQENGSSQLPVYALLELLVALMKDGAT